MAGYMSGFSLLSKGENKGLSKTKKIQGPFIRVLSVTIIFRVPSVEEKAGVKIMGGRLKI